MATALIVVDLQNDFCPGGALAVTGGDGIVPAVNRLIAAFEHVILTQDWHPAGHASFASSHAGRAPFESIALGYGEQTLWPDHCIQNTPGAAFHPGLVAGKVELVIRKGFRRDIDSYSAFFENDRRTPTGLAGYLRDRGFDRLVMCGLATDYCVGWSALDGCAAGFTVSLVEDASAAIDLEGSLTRARSALDAAGVARIDTTRALELA
jgi:nicotinamidase/pyrazinamidase